MGRTLLVAAFLAASPVFLGASTCLQQLGEIDSGSDFLRQAIETAGKVDDAVTGNFAKVVAEYCDKVPGSARTALRNHLNARPEMNGASVAISCPGD